MVRMDAPRASLSREMCAFLKGVGCIVVSSLAVYLLLSGLSTTGAEVVGYFAPVGYGVATWEIDFVPPSDAEQKPEAHQEPGQPMRVALPDPAAAGESRRCVQPRIVMTADALIDAYATPLAAGGSSAAATAGTAAGAATPAVRAAPRTPRARITEVYLSRASPSDAVTWAAW